MVALVSRAGAASVVVGDCEDVRAHTHPEAVVGVVGHPFVEARRRFRADLAHSDCG